MPEWRGGRRVLDYHFPAVSGKHRFSIVDNPDYLDLVQDLPLHSPSAAGAVLCGGQVNGRKQWKDASGTV
jgi:hypothetical protein